MWYNTFSHYLMKEETVTPFQRCHYEPCCFTHFVNSDDADEDQPPVRIVLMIYVDDGQTWDNCPEVCDAFYVRMTTRFSTTVGGGGMSYMLGSRGRDA